MMRMSFGSGPAGRGIFHLISALLFAFAGIACEKGDAQNPAGEAGEIGSSGGVLKFAEIEVEPGEVAVNPGIPVGEESVHVVTVRNTGKLDLKLNGFAFDYETSAGEEGDDPPAFRLSEVRGCTGESCNDVWDALAEDLTDMKSNPIVIGAPERPIPYAYVEVEVIFHRPKSSDTREATLRIPSNADGAPAEGLKVAFSTSTGNARITVTPPEIDFGSVKSGEEPAIPISIQNTGSDVLKIHKVKFTGSDYFQLMVDGEKRDPVGDIDFDPPIEIEQGEVYAIDALFHPATADPATASLYVLSNDATAPEGGVEVIIKGNTSGPCIAIHPKTLNFGGKMTGQLSVLPIEIRSCGSDPLEITSIEWTEGSSFDFSIDYTSLGDAFKNNSAPSADNPLIVPINQKVELTIRFVPDAENPKDEEGQPIPDEGHILVANNTFEDEIDVEVQGVGVDINCPVAVIYVQEGEQVIPQTTLHLFGDQSFSPAGPIKKWEWSAEQPLGSQTIFLPSANFPDPTFEANVAGSYLFRLTVWDYDETPSCVPAEAQVVVIPDEAIHVELLWDTPNDPNQTDEGPEAGADVDLHFLHEFASGPDLDGDGEPDGWFDAPFDCFFMNTSPQWGSFDPAIDDDPGLDRDDTDGAGPENLNLNIPENNKTYRVGVHYWHDHGYGPSYATVRIYIYAQLVFELADVKLLNHDMWDVATIDWPSGNVSQVGDGFKITPNYENPYFFQP